MLGCAVNGIGEASHADFGIAGAKDMGVIYSKGKALRKVPTEELVDVLFEEIDKYYAAGKKVVVDEASAAEGEALLAEIEAANARRPDPGAPRRHGGRGGAQRGSVAHRRPAVHPGVTYVAAEARQELLDDIAAAIEDMGLAVTALGAAYELVDEHTGDTLEAEVFRPAQLAYGRARRVHTEFASRHGLPTRDFTAPAPGTLNRPAGELIDTAVGQATHADALLAELQDSLRPVEVGDAELRAGLAEVRTLLDRVPAGARGVQRVLGR